MAHYAIGDLQGCYDELEALLAKSPSTTAPTPYGWWAIS